MKTIILVVLMSVMMSFTVTLAGYGDPVTSSSDTYGASLPTEAERQMFVAFNWLRSDPVYWKNTFGSLNYWGPNITNVMTNSKYKVQNAVHYNRQMNGAEHYHTYDMAANSPPNCTAYDASVDCPKPPSNCQPPGGGICCFRTIDCHNTSEDYDQRFYRFGFTRGQTGADGELIGAGPSFAPPTGVIPALAYIVCDQPDPTQTVCPPDQDSARDVIFGVGLPSQFTAGSAGYWGNGSSQFVNYWSVGIGYSTNAPPSNNPIASAVYLNDPVNGWTFMANYAPSTVPNSAYVVISGVAHALSQISSGHQNYYYAYPFPSACTDYYFMFVDSSKTVWRYPEGGNLEGGPACSSAPVSWVADTANCTCSGSGTCFQGTCVPVDPTHKDPSFVSPKPGFASRLSVNFIILALVLLIPFLWRK